MKYKGCCSNKISKHFAFPFLVHIAHRVFPVFGILFLPLKILICLSGEAIIVATGFSKKKKKKNAHLETLHKMSGEISNKKKIADFGCIDDKKTTRQPFSHSSPTELNGYPA